MTDIFIAGAGVTAGGADTKNSFIMYENLMPDCTVTAGGDVGRLHDWMTNIFYSQPAGTFNIDLDLPFSQAVNCAAVAGVNWDSGGVTMKFYTWNGSAYVLQFEAANFDDQQPVMRVFPTVFTTKVRYTFTCTSTTYIGEAAFGQALQMPSCPSIGLQPAEWSDEDEYSYSVTQTRNLGPSTIERKGSVQVMDFKFISVDFMDGPIKTMRKIAKGRPIWVGWNQKDRLASVIFGHWKLNKPVFDSQVFTSIKLTIEGVV